MSSTKMILFVTAGLLMGAKGSAQETSVSVMKAEASALSPIRLSLALTKSSNLYKEGSADREASTEFALAPSYQLTQDLSFKLATSVVQEDTGARNSSLSNTSLTLAAKGPSNKDLASQFSLSGIAPTNEDDRKTQRLRGAVSIGANVSQSLKSVSLGYGLSIKRNFHEFTINSSGSPNIQYSLSHKLSLDADISSRWSVGLSGAYRQGWTYKDFQRSLYAFEAGLNYGFSKNWQASMGLSTEGNALKANGRDSNIKFYDENTSALQAGVTFVN